MTSDPRDDDSESLEPVIADLIEDPVSVIAFQSVGLITGEELKALNEVNFELSTFVPLIPGFADPDTYHTFTLIVTDKTGVSNQWELTFHVPADYEG